MFNFLRKDSSKSIHVNDIEDLIGKIDLIDIREPHEFKSVRIKSAENIPMSNIIKYPNKYLKKGKKYYIICQSGSRSKIACKLLSLKGFNVINVAGGVGSYVSEKKDK